VGGTIFAHCVTWLFKFHVARLTYTYSTCIISSVRDSYSNLMGRCPTCKQPLGTQGAKLPVGRICSLYERRISRHEKYIHTRSGVRHRDCSDPESYGPLVVDTATIETGKETCDASLRDL
jgi:hypothetical protein